MFDTIGLVVILGLSVGSVAQTLVNQDLECVCMNKKGKRMSLKISLADDHQYKSCDKPSNNLRPKDCKEVLDFGFKTNGVYRIFPKGNIHGYNVYCDLTTDGGGWTVFQRRLDGSVDFYKTWREYMNGFGDVNGEYWLGNEKIHELTSLAKSTLRIDMMDQAGIWKYAIYNEFSISDNSTGYNLTVGDYSGNAGNSLSGHNNNTFKTKDNSDNECAKKYFGAWWYTYCHSSNLNGLYNNTEYGKGMNWRPWHGYYYSLKATEMKIKRV